jgi:hypothetical protein
MPAPLPSALATTIVTMFELHGLEPSAIAADQELEEIVVKATLLQNSSKYRELCKSEENAEHEYVTKEETQEFVEAYKRIARYTEDDYIKERALKNLINMGLKVNEGLGVQDTRKLLKEFAGSGNILNLNMIIQQARAAKEKVTDKVNKVIEIQSEEIPA